MHWRYPLPRSRGRLHQGGQWCWRYPTVLGFRCLSERHTGGHDDDAASKEPYPGERGRDLCGGHGSRNLCRVALHALSVRPVPRASSASSSGRSATGPTTRRGRGGKARRSSAKTADDSVAEGVVEPDRAVVPKVRRGHFQHTRGVEGSVGQGANGTGGPKVPGSNPAARPISPWSDDRRLTPRLPS